MAYTSAGLLIILLSIFSSLYAQPEKVTRKPLRVGVVGLVHDHVHGILGRENRGDIEIVGIAEPNHDLAVQLFKAARL